MWADVVPRVIPEGLAARVDALWREIDVRTEVHQPLDDEQRESLRGLGYLQ